MKKYDPELVEMLVKVLMSQLEMYKQIIEILKEKRK